MKMRSRFLSLKSRLLYLKSRKTGRYGNQGRVFRCLSRVKRHSSRIKRDQNFHQSRWDQAWEFPPDVYCFYHKTLTIIKENSRERDIFYHSSCL